MCLIPKKLKSQYFVEIFLILVSFLFLNHVLAQSNAFEPSLIYHIQDNLELQKLPSPQWILQEGESDLTVEDLLKGEYKDASFIDLSSTPVFKMKVILLTG